MIILLLLNIFLKDMFERKLRELRQCYEFA